MIKKLSNELLLAAFALVMIFGIYEGGAFFKDVFVDSVMALSQKLQASPVHAQSGEQAGKVDQADKPNTLIFTDKPAQWFANQPIVHKDNPHNLSAGNSLFTTSLMQASASDTPTAYVSQSPMTPNLTLWGTISLRTAKMTDPIIDGDTFWIKVTRLQVGSKYVTSHQAMMQKEGVMYSRIFKVGRFEKVRLRQIDSPEYNARYTKKVNQPGGKEAKQFLSKLLPIGAKVRVTSVTLDSLYPERTVGFVLKHYGRQDKADDDIGFALVSNGHAWYAPAVYPSPSFDPKDWYSKAHAEAKENKRGLWLSGDAIEPSEWRKTRTIFQ